jgi:hypothetical protein
VSLPFLQLFTVFYASAAVAQAMTPWATRDGGVPSRGDVNIMAFANLPRAIEIFIQAARTRDLDAILATFSANAVVIDEGVAYRGDALRGRIERLLLGETIHPINVARREGKTIVTVVLKWYGDGTVIAPSQLDLSFMIADSKIYSLTIARSHSPPLPAPVAAYVSAANTFNLEALLRAFADDAMVNDQLREYRGKKAIRDWAAREIVGDRVTMYVVRAIEHYGNAIITANVDGDYDKRGLPDPLEMTFYFSLHEGKIVQLIILRNEQGV